MGISDLDITGDIKIQQTGRAERSRVIWGYPSPAVSE